MYRRNPGRENGGHPHPHHVEDGRNRHRRPGRVRHRLRRRHLLPADRTHGKPYFTLPAAAFGGGWSAGNCIRFNTYGTPMPVWILRSVQPSAARQTEKDGFTACLRGNTVAE